jgi:hypothetical protein
MRAGLVSPDSQTIWRDNTYVEEMEYYAGDPYATYDVLEAVFPRMIWDYDVADWQWLAGISGQGPTSVEEHGFEPEQFDYLGAQDATNYGNVFSLASRTLAGRFGLPDRLNRPGGDTQVMHVSCSGAVVQALSDGVQGSLDPRRSDDGRMTFDLAGSVLRRPWENLTDGVHVVGGTVYGSSWSSRWGGWFNLSLYDLVERFLKPYIVSNNGVFQQSHYTIVGSFLGTLWLSREYRDFVFEYDEVSRLSAINWTFVLGRRPANVLNPWPRQNQAFRQRVQLDRYGTAKDISRIPWSVAGGIVYPVSLRYNGLVTRTQSAIASECYTEDANGVRTAMPKRSAVPPLSLQIDGDMGTVVTNHFSTLSGPDSEDLAYRKLFDGDSHLSKLKAAGIGMTLDMPNLRAAATLAASDAMDEGFRVVSNDLLESIVELRDIASFCEFSVPLTEVVVLVLRRRFGEALKRLPGLATSLALAWSYAIKPSAEQADEIVSVLGNVISKLSGYGSRSFTTYGVYRTSLDLERVPHAWRSYDHVDLEVRTRLTFRLTGDAWESVLLWLKASGLMPGLGAVWDVIPFSFVYDWARDTDSPLEALDNTALALCLDLEQASHSYAVRLYYSTAQLDEAHVETIAGLDAPHIKLYRRETSFLYPIVISSTYDLWAGTNVPTTITSGSLAFQVSSQPRRVLIDLWNLLGKAKPAAKRRHAPRTA